MMIRNMFADDINRNIGGVVRVDQDDTHVILQEVNEYVITRELRRHFAAFFNYYSEAFQTPTDDIGVWISGFFGSGKSHFLKMLSYLLENREIDGIRTVERFRAKFADDPATFMNIDASTRGETQTILFNIDAEGPINKNKTAVLRVFAKMFYNHLGFYGENLKVAKLEQFIAKRGKTDDFRRCFAERTGTEWLDSRDAFVFFEDDVVAALVETLGMSETAARNWFDGSEDVDMSITRLVTEIKEYLDTKPKNFRLLFMVDEVGQYVGTDTNLLLNLQTLVEKIGSECGGRVWVVCTGQEAIDEIIRVRADEFSRIQARFKTRLSLSSSSVDEVIQKRILKKTPDAAAQLTALYNENNAVLRNLFSFTDAILDIKGYGGPQQFADNFPLRFTNRSFLNDESEGRYVLQLLKKRIDEILPVISNEEKQSQIKAAIIEEIENMLDKMDRDPEGVYQVSFSTKQDSLCMWNYYADDGYCIHFDKECLINSFKKLVCPQIEKERIDKVLVSGQVIYDVEQQMQILKDISAPSTGCSIPARKTASNA